MRKRKIGEPKKRVIMLKIDVSDDFQDPLLEAYLELQGEFEEMDEERFVSLASKVDRLSKTEAARYLKYRYLSSAFLARKAIESSAMAGGGDQDIWKGRLDSLKYMVLPLVGEIILRAKTIKEKWKVEKEKEDRRKKANK